MARTLTTPLDDATFEHALAVLDRARPSPGQDRLFQLLNLAVWIAVTLAGVYFVLRRTGGLAPGSLAGITIAWAIALVYVAIVPLFVVNWPLVRKLWRAARRQRQLATSLKRRISDQFRVRRRERRLLHLTTFILNIVGLIVAVGALAGVLLAATAGDPVAPRLALYAVAAVFGVSCMFLHFMARGRERLKVIADLRTTLIAAHDPADERQLTAEAYDEIAHIERGQIAADRRRSVKAASKKSFARTYAAKEHRAVREVKQALPPDTLMRVQACIDTLTRNPEETASEIRSGVSYTPIPGTTLELGYAVDTGAREIKVLSVSPVAGEWPL